MKANERYRAEITIEKGLLKIDGRRVPKILTGATARMRLLNTCRGLQALTDNPELTSKLAMLASKQGFRSRFSVRLKDEIWAALRRRDALPRALRTLDELERDWNDDVNKRKFKARINGLKVGEKTELQTRSGRHITVEKARSALKVGFAGNITIVLKQWSGLMDNLFCGVSLLRYSAPILDVIADGKPIDEKKAAVMAAKIDDANSIEPPTFDCAKFFRRNLLAHRIQSLKTGQSLTRRLSNDLEIRVEHAGKTLRVKTSIKIELSEPWDKGNLSLDLLAMTYASGEHLDLNFSELVSNWSGDILIEGKKTRKILARDSTTVAVLCECLVKNMELGVRALITEGSDAKMENVPASC